MQQCCVVMFFLTVFNFVHSTSIPDDAATPSFKVDYDGGRFLLDGKPFRYISGSIHYFRIHPDQWEDRLKRVRALGFNAIQYYVPWNFHEVEKGEFNFSGWRNFTRFSQIAADLGMYTLLRWGPYACAEWENGGLPYWLIADHQDIKMRTNDTRFTTELSRWFHALGPVVRPMLRENGGPVLMVQIENEYGTIAACDHDYNLWLRDLTWQLLGSNTVLYTTDTTYVERLNCGAIAGTLTTVDFRPVDNATVNDYFNLQRKHLPNGKGPLVNSEFYPGWYVEWGQTGQHHFTSQKDEHIMDTVKNMYALGASFNFYMIHGGTNFGFWNGAKVEGAVITSYDYTAPISEAGDFLSIATKLRDWIKTLDGWPSAPQDLPAAMLRRSYSRVALGKTALVTEMTKGKCVNAPDPVSFEQVRQHFGYLQYTTIIPHDEMTYLSIDHLEDFGYVFLDHQRQGMFIKQYFNTSVRIVTLNDLKPGSRLDIIVENQGRQTDQTINDFKGILSPVKLDNIVLTNWTTCALSVSAPYESRREGIELDTSDEASGVYQGTFSVDTVADTWINMRGWGKGHVVINGHNVGRYWSTVGPQYNLFVPSPLLNVGNNSVSVYEFLGATKDACNDSGTCTVSFDDHADITFTDDQPETTTHIETTTERAAPLQSLSVFLVMSLIMLKCL